MKMTLILRRAIGFCSFFLVFGWFPDAHAEAAEALPRQPVLFTGSLQPSEANSTPVFPEVVSAPAEAPNILLVMTDDVGFGAAGTFGGLVPTPHLDAVAAQGLIYNRFHTTAVCSPTRAALLTGRNHHSAGTGNVVEMSAPYPGYRGVISLETASIARVLRDNGYSTAMFGKDHNVPSHERSVAGPFHNWPTGRGFDYFYGFIGADTNQWEPGLTEGISPVDTSNRRQDYLLDEELADKAIGWIQNQKAAAPERPFFIYYATGSAHAPHQAPQEWIEQFRGKFDTGWDAMREKVFAVQKASGIIPPDTKLPPRPDRIPAWDSLSDNQKLVYARFAEVFAAQLAFQDAQFGRIVKELDRMGLRENTLIIFIQGDNGPSAEGAMTGTLNEMADLGFQVYDTDIDWLVDNLDELGGPRTYQTHPAGWAYAMATPFPWFKNVASHLGGTRNGLVISWPQRIKQQGELRDQYHHVIDIAPTILEASGVKAPQLVDGITQKPMQGVSMLYSFDAAQQPSRRTTQYYEINANRAIYHEGWLANTKPISMPWESVGKGGDGNVEGYEWELYHLDSDFSQSTNLASEKPEKLRQMQVVFDREARVNQVYPLQDSSAHSRAMRMAKASGKKPRTEFVYWGRGVELTMDASPPIFFAPFTITAEIEVPESGGEGVILAAGSGFGGWSFYLVDGKPVAYASRSPLQNRQYRVAAQQSLEPGGRTVQFQFKPSKRGGEMTISVDNDVVSTGIIEERPLLLAGNGETFDIGRDRRGAISPEYLDEGVFNGKIRRVEVQIMTGR